MSKVILIDEFNAIRKKAEELRKEMDKKIAEMDVMNKYTMYAERNPELAKMLETYRELVD